MTSWENGHERQKMTDMYLSNTGMDGDADEAAGADKVAVAVAVGAEAEAGAADEAAVGAAAEASTIQDGNGIMRKHGRLNKTMSQPPAKGAPTIPKARPRRGP